jgi:hypothetical protein
MGGTKDEVLQIASSLGMQPTDEQIRYVLDNLHIEAENDPTGNRVLWIENLLYNITRP